jgi:hypothetical protein
VVYNQGHTGKLEGTVGHVVASHAAKQALKSITAFKASEGPSPRWRGATIVKSVTSGSVSGQLKPSTVVVIWPVILTRLAMTRIPQVIPPGGQLTPAEVPVASEVDQLEECGILFSDVLFHKVQMGMRNSRVGETSVHTQVEYFG